MNIRTYTAASMAEALLKVKQDLGSDAVVLHTRTYKQGGFLGIGARTMVEVSAANGRQIGQKKRQQRDGGSRASLASHASNGRSGGAFDDRVGDRSRQRFGSGAGMASPAVGSQAESPMAGELIKQAYAAAQAELARQSGVPSTGNAGMAAAPQGRGSLLASAAGAYGQQNDGSVIGSPASVLAAQTASQLPRNLKTSPTPGAFAPADGMLPPGPGYVAAMGGQAQAGPSNDSAWDRARVQRQTAQAPHAAGSDGGQDWTPRIEQAVAQRTEQLTQEMAEIRRLVTRMVLAQDGLAPQNGVQMPDHLFDAYRHLIEQELSQELAEEAINGAHLALNDQQLGDANLCDKAVRRATANLMAQQVSTVDDAGQLPSHGPKVIALVGPTGVGKTTTVAKLAATHKLRFGHHVGLITLDTYRIAAVEQLKVYAKIIGLPLHVVASADELQRSVRMLAGCDVVLIDTAGRSPNNKERIEELAELMAVAQPTETHLVMSATCSLATMLKTAERFDCVSPNRLIYTKLDEAESYGSLLTVARQLGKPVSYLTTGQEVPHQIEPCRSERLAQLVFDGRLDAAAVASFTAQPVVREEPREQPREQAPGQFVERVAEPVREPVQVPAATLESDQNPSGETRQSSAKPDTNPRGTLQTLKMAGLEQVKDAASSPSPTPQARPTDASGGAEATASRPAQKAKARTRSHDRLSTTQGARNGGPKGSYAAS